MWNSFEKVLSALFNHIANNILLGTGNSFLLYVLPIAYFVNLYIFISICNAPYKSNYLISGATIKFQIL